MDDDDYVWLGLVTVLWSIFIVLGGWIFVASGTRFGDSERSEVVGELEKTQKEHP